MPTKPQQTDIVSEVRELLCDFPEIVDAAYNTELALFADAVERERQSPFFGCSKKVARVYARAPELLRQLADEVERFKRGDFTDDELQNFCHNLDEDNRRAFFDGCTKYQERLFGTSAVAEARKDNAK